MFRFNIFFTIAVSTTLSTTISAVVSQVSQAGLTSNFIFCGEKYDLIFLTCLLLANLARMGVTFTIFTGGTGLFIGVTTLGFQI